MKLYPVVHMQSSEHATALSHQAMEAGADGVFLIDHLTYKQPEPLADAYRIVQRELGSSAFIGVNFLGLTPSQVVEYTALHHWDQVPSAFWADDAVDNAETGNILSLKTQLGIPKLQYFGGVAFKYTLSFTSSPEKAAALARHYTEEVDVMTTSGPGTGIPATLEKVKAMKAAIGDQPLALASGVSVENIASYAGAVDIVLAASSIETGPYTGEFIPSKMRDLIQAAHEL